jgi:hypothetical protein
MRLQQAREAADAAHLPFRICETNSFSGGGRPGVSDTFGAALWVMDYMFILASGHAAGVNIETGINQLDFISSYSPLAGNAGSGYSVGPDYYGMLAFAQAASGRTAPTKTIAVDFDPGGMEMTAYAVRRDEGVFTLSILNKEAVREARLAVQAASRSSHAHALWLRAPRLDSKDGVTLGGASVAPDGWWKPESVEKIALHAEKCEFRMPPASAVVLTFAG